MKYIDFLKRKVAIAPSSGFEPEKINTALFPHQADSVRWALRGGRRAIFAAFGNGKTVMGNCQKYVVYPNVPEWALEGSQAG